MITCRSCGTDNLDRARFCDSCGVELADAPGIVCPRCGAWNRSVAHFCQTCGRSIEAPAAHPEIVSPREPTAVPESTLPETAVPEMTAPEIEEPPAAAADLEPGLEVPVTPVEPTPPPGDTTGEFTDLDERPTAPTPPPPPRVTGPPLFLGRGEGERPAAPTPQSPAHTTPPAPRRTGPPLPHERHRRQHVEQPIEPPRPAGPPRTPIGVSAREWAAARQADILLYLGAFLLVVAALLFVGSRGEEISPELRVLILLVYTWAFIIAGFIAHRSPKIREASAVFLAIGALITPLNFLLIYVELLDDRGVDREVVWLIGSVYSAVFYSVLWKQGYGRLYSVPAAIAVINSWGALAPVLNLPYEWYGAWWITFVTLASAAAALLRRYGPKTALVAAIFIALFFVGQSGWWADHHWPLPVSLLLIGIWLSLTGAYLRKPWLLPAAATGAIAAATAALWAMDLEADWFAYPALAGALVAVWSRRLWEQWSEPLARFGWVYAAAGGSTPIVLLASYEAGAHGAVAFAAGTAVFASIAWCDVRRNALHLIAPEAPPEPTTVPERTFFAWVAFGMMLVAVAYTQRELDIGRPDTGWSYLAIALAPIVLLGLTGRRWTPALAVLVPPALIAIIISLQDPELYPGHDAILLGVPATAFFATFAVTWRWPITLVASVLAILAAAAAWRALEWETWTLAIAYSLVGVGSFAVLTPLRRYVDSALDARALIVQILSWGFVILGPVVAWLSYGRIADVSDPAFTHSAEYRTTFYLILLVAPLILYEGWRFKNWTVTAAGTGLASAAVAPFWPSYDWPTWTLALAYLVIGIVRFGTMTPVRTYQPTRQQASIVVLSWALVAAAPLTAFIALQQRLADSDVIAHDTTEYLALMSVLLAFTPLVLFEAWRFKNWVVTLIGTAIAVGPVAGYWPSFDWEWWTLACAYLATGIGIFAATTRFRTYDSNGEQTAIVVLAWGVIIAAPMTAGLALIEQVDFGAVAVKTVEYRTLTVAIFAFAPLNAFEAWRLRSRLAAALASVAAITSLLLTIAIWQPDSVQAYTLAVGIYLVLFGLVVRRSLELVERHLMLHEGILLVGVGYILGPSVVEGLQPGGAEWGFVVLAEGAVFILIGLLLSSRWLTVSGVLAMSGVAIRWTAVNTGKTIPYWLTLGGVGLLLLSVGTAMLLGRDQWIRLRDATIRWWRRTASLSGLEVSPDSVLAPIAVVIIGFVIAAGIADWEGSESPTPVSTRVEQSVGTHEAVAMEDGSNRLLLSIDIDLPPSVSRPPSDDIARRLVDWRSLTKEE